MRLGALLHEEPSDRPRAKLAQAKIVRRRSGAVRVALQLDDESWILVQPLNDVAQGRACLIVGDPFVDAKLDHDGLDDGQPRPASPEPRQPLGSTVTAGASSLSAHRSLLAPPLPH